MYYNRFRYYDKDTGQYISPYPIGLLGGFNPYGYVYCPVGWVDPFGLAGTSLVTKITLPQGMTQSKFNNFSSALKNAIKQENLPNGQLYIHGSRAKGTAISGQSDIDIMLVISDSKFGSFAARRIEESSGRTQKNIVKTVSNQQRINGRGISKTFEATIWDHVFPTLPQGEFSKVQVSIMTEKSPFNTGPYIQIE